MVSANLCNPHKHKFLKSTSHCLLIISLFTTKHLRDKCRVKQVEKKVCEPAKKKKKKRHQNCGQLCADRPVVRGLKIFA